jgi:hypothetical protein
MRNLLVVVVFAVLGGVAGRVSWDALTVRAPTTWVRGSVPATSRGPC